MLLVITLVAVGSWDTANLRYIPIDWGFLVFLVDLACDPTQHADLGAVIMHEGLCHVCLITASMTIVRAKIDMNVPRKRKGYCGQHDKVLCQCLVEYFIL